MIEEVTNRAKLGVFVLIATACLLVGLYFIGSKKNMFSSTINVSSTFSNVGGLMSGNNVRYNGINVGTVSKVYAIADTIIKVEFTINEESTKFVGKNATTSIGTDGLLGNKLLNITASLVASTPVAEGDVLQSTKAVEMEAIMRTINASSGNLQAITENLKETSIKLNDKNSIINLMKDSMLNNDVKSSIVNLRLMSNQAVMITGNIKAITDDVKHGKGSLGALITDTLLSTKISQTVVKLQRISDTAAIIIGNISQIVNKLKQGKGTAGVLLNDTTLVHNLNKTIISIDSAANTFNADMKGLQHSWLLRKYFKKGK